MPKDRVCFGCSEITSFSFAWSPGAMGAPEAVESACAVSPLLSISYHFGSKFMRGYFTDHAGRAQLLMMIIERTVRDAIGGSSHTFASFIKPNCWLGTARRGIPSMSLR